MDVRLLLGVIRGNRNTVSLTANFHEPYIYILYIIVFGDFRLSCCVMLYVVNEIELVENPFQIFADINNLIGSSICKACLLAFY